MKKLLIIPVVILFVNTIHAQQYVDLFKLNYLQGWNNKFKEGGSTKFSELTADVTLPIQIDSTFSIITGLVGERYELKLNGFDKEESKFFATGIKIGVNKKFGKWSGSVVYVPRFVSDFKSKINNYDFQSLALGLFKYQKNQNLKYNIGLVYLSDLGGPFFVPLLGFYYQSPSKKHEWNFVLPVWAHYNYSLTKNVSLGTNFKSYIRSFKIHNNSYAYNNHYVTLLSSEINAYLRFEPLKGVLIEGKVGHSFLRTSSLYSSDDKYELGVSAFKFGDNRNQLNNELMDGPYAKLRLIYRFYL